MYAVVLVPSAELAVQVSKVFVGLIYYCSHLIQVLSVASDSSVDAQVYVLGSRFDCLKTTFNVLSMC